MLIKIDVDSELLEKMESLVKQEKYHDIYQFIKIALNNQIQEESANPEQNPISENDSLTSQIRKHIVESQQDLLRSISDIPLEKSQIPPPVQSIIWSFYNRLFPVKIIVHQLAIMMGTQNTWIELSQLHDTAYAFAESLSSKLREYEESHNLVRNQKISTGLPTPMSEINKGRGFQRQKIQSKVIASKIRFIEHFIGKLTSKSSPFEFKGACFELGLVGVKVEGNTCLVSLTDLGRDFALLENPILDNDQYDGVFSDDESDFIVEKIIPQFKLENIIVTKILEGISEKNQLVADDIDKIFETEYLQYHKKEKPKKPKELESFEKEMVRIRVATMGRLSELNKVKWIIDKAGKSIYSKN
ncbi:MAG: hypothetical protein ACW9W3_05875 [Candidatus Nitrosopumilus sp. bin_68KS]